jgi:hypothetical protein
MNNEAVCSGEVKENIGATERSDEGKISVLNILVIGECTVLDPDVCSTLMINIR